MWEGPFFPPSTLLARAPNATVQALRESAESLPCSWSQFIAPVVSLAHGPDSSVLGSHSSKVWPYFVLLQLTPLSPLSPYVFTAFPLCSPPRLHISLLRDSSRPWASWQPATGPDPAAEPSPEDFPAPPPLLHLQSFSPAASGVGSRMGQLLSLPMRPFSPSSFVCGLICHGGSPLHG